MNASKEPWMSHSFLINFLLFGKKYLWKELVRRSPSDGFQYSRIEEIDRIYDFLANLNPKFDIVRGHTLGQRPIPSLMEVFSKIHHVEDCTSARSISTTFTTNFAAFNVRSSTSGSDKHNGKQIPICENCNDISIHVPDIAGGKLYFILHNVSLIQDHFIQNAPYESLHYMLLSLYRVRVFILFVQV